LKPGEKLSECHAPYLMNHYLRKYLIKIGRVLSPKKYFDIIIKPLYSKQLLNLVLVEDCGVVYSPFLALSV
jgi:hypothetical protein